MLTHAQIQTTEEDKSLCNHQTDTQPFVLCGLSDLVICKLRKKVWLDRLLNVNTEIRNQT